MEKKPTVPTSLHNYIETGNKPQYARLPSLRPPRDLTLADQKPKKIFAPNVNAVRFKDRGKLIVKQQIEHKKSLDKQQRNKTDLNKFTRVQSGGAFSEGIADVKRTKFRPDTEPGPSTSSGKCNGSRTRSTKLKLQNLKLIDCDSDSDVERESTYTPLVLPLNRNSEGFWKIFQPKEKKQLKVKEEPSLDKEQSNVETPPLPTDNENQGTIFDRKKMYDEDNPAFSLIQFPSSLCGKWVSDDPDEKDPDYLIKNMQEGQIGKIIKRKSGKMELIIEGMTYKLTAEQDVSYVQDVVMLPGKESSSFEPCVTTLGRVSEVLQATPEWDKLFQNKEKESAERKFMLKNFKSYPKLYDM